MATRVSRDAKSSESSRTKRLRVKKSWELRLENLPKGETRGRMMPSDFACLEQRRPMPLAQIISRVGGWVSKAMLRCSGEAKLPMRHTKWV